MEQVSETVYVIRRHDGRYVRDGRPCSSVKTATKYRSEQAANKCLTRVGGIYISPDEMDDAKSTFDGLLQHFNVIEVEVTYTINDH